ncbi:hypothetical protein OIO90_001029 [Microbotryomycetes sp. JL221]|nr:hypothetical protein OIO90_001029 [Microbotryomycetes sp. JL221]
MPSASQQSRWSALTLLAVSLLAQSALAAPSGAGARVDPVQASKPTPTLVAQQDDLPPVFPAEDARIISLISAMSAAATAKAKRSLNDQMPSLDDIVDPNLLQARDYPMGNTDPVLVERAPASTSCLDSTATDVDINEMFYYGGQGATVWLCPGANIKITNSIFFTAAKQMLATQGGNDRATIEVTGDQQSNAIYGACDACNNIAIRNVQIYGARDKLGWIPGGLALLEMGGSTSGQLVRTCKIWEPRGWSALHFIEGHQLDCTGAQILYNDIGPAGNAPNTGVQFKRQTGGTITPGQWADGVSLACRNSRVVMNRINDATDGQIVIFGSPGSTISNNIITTQYRQALGGINMVDYGPFGGTFEGVVVENNKLNAHSAMMKVGIAMGSMTWGSNNQTAARTYGGTVRNNVLRSGTSRGFFGYGISLAGHNNAVVQDNDGSTGNYGGKPSVACIPQPMVPAPQAFVHDSTTTTGSQVQSEFDNKPLVFMICTEPGPIVGKGLYNLVQSATDVVKGVLSRRFTSTKVPTEILADSALERPELITDENAPEILKRSGTLSAPLSKRTPPIPGNMVNPFSLLAAGRA